MIKMTIGGEEVVCNKEFTIKEEMLSTSSTILNNCYPKSWEQDHDYTSRFYYPKDYSKCLIYDEKPLLPKEYTQVDYIESSGTQYIDTGVNADNNLRVVLDIAYTTLATSNQNIGAIRLESDNNARYHILTQANYFRVFVNDAGYNTINRDTNRHLFDIKPSLGIATVDNQDFTIPSGIRDVNLNFWLFGRNSTRALYYTKAKQWACKMYYSDVLVRDFIPCYRNSDNEVGLYDLVNNVFYTNQGTGAFTYGQVQETITTKLLFSGMIKNTGNISLNPREPKYCSLEILDFKDFLSTGEYLDFVISNKTVLEAIQMVVEAVSQYGFVLGNVNIIGGNDIIGAYSTQEKSAYDVFQYLAEITQSRWTTRMIDENTIAIDFYDPTLMPQGQDIDYTSEWWCQKKVNDLKFNYGSRDYRNKQVMLSSQVYGGTDYSETILGDGYNKNFNTTENIGNIISILVNGNEATFSTNVDKEMGIDTDFYYTPGNNSIEGENYTAGTQITITYTPLIKGREVVYNTNEVQRINNQIERKGVVARYEQRNDILYTEDLEKIGQTYIKYKGSAEVILTLTTQVDIYNVGEVVYFNAPITELAQNYMVKNKQTQIITTGDYSNVWYTYELTSSFNSETAINWFDNQRNKTNGNISEGEYITRNIDYEQTANVIWDNLTITEVTSVGDNILNAPLNAPFTK